MMGKLSGIVARVKAPLDTDKDGHVSRAEAEAPVRAAPLTAMAISFACGFGSALLLVGIYLLGR